MRKIEFRGKDVHDGTWHYGSLIVLDSDYYIAEHGEGKKDTEYEVEPESVGQYTGLKDIQGVRVYEGDMLTLGGYMFNCEIIYDEYNAKFVAVEQVGGNVWNISGVFIYEHKARVKK